MTDPSRTASEHVSGANGELSREEMIHGLAKHLLSLVAEIPSITGQGTRCATHSWTSSPRSSIRTVFGCS